QARFISNDRCSLFHCLSILNSHPTETATGPSLYLATRRPRAQADESPNRFRAAKPAAVAWFRSAPQHFGRSLTPSKCKHRDRLLLFRRLALQLDEDEVNRTLSDVFRQMRAGLFPHCLARLADPFLALTVGVGELGRLVDQKHRHAIGMMVHDGFLADPVMDTQHPHLVVLEIGRASCRERG